MNIIKAYNELINGNNIKPNLQLIKEEIKINNDKGTQNRAALVSHINNDIAPFIELLNSQDAKIRKNTALIIKVLAIPGLLDALYEAYEKEETLFVKGSYLSAMQSYDYSTYIDRLNTRRNKIISMDISYEESKHYTEEMKKLNSMLTDISSATKHEYTGYNLVNEAALLTNRNFKDITLKALKGIPHKEYTAGVMVKTKNIAKVLPIRTYSEILFLLPSIKTCPYDAFETAKLLMDAGIVNYLEARHKESDSPFYFRIEARIKEDKFISGFVHKLAGQLEVLSHWKLINSISDYEIEIRLIEDKNGNLKPLLKLFTIPDYRFTYRQNAIAASIKPDTAALLANLASPYFKEDAVVLDPFCGVGTMLVEREKHTKTQALYGIDIFGDAITKAKQNIKHTGLSDKVNLINRDFFDFKHDYLFDEIFTNMPFPTDKKNISDINFLHKQFLDKAKTHLKPSGYIFMYTHSSLFMKKYSDPDYNIISSFEISKVEGSYFYILKYKD